jgi:putative transposase
MKKQRNNPHNLLLNGDVLSLSANVIKDLLGLNSAPNVVYSDKTIIFHLLNASVSQTSINHVSDLCINAPSEGTIRYRLRNLDLNEVQQVLNEKLKIHAIETVSNKCNIFAIDFVNIPFYGKEKNKGDTIKTKPKQGTSRFYAYASIILNIK